MQNSYRHYIYLVLAGAVLYVPFLGGVHLFDWDEINFAESAREMIISGDFLTVQIDFKPFWEKPPLFIWMQVVSMKIFGINEFAARFPNAVCGIVTLLVLYNAGRKLISDKFGMIWSIMYGISFLPLLYFKSGIIDPWFNLFIFIGLHCFFLFYTRRSGDKDWKNLLFSAVFIGLAVMTKGPVGLLIFMLVSGFIILLNRFRFNAELKHIFSWLSVFALIGGSWFILLIINGNYGIIIEFFEYQVRLFRTEDAGHGGFLLYHFVVLLFGVFPSSILALSTMFRKNEDIPDIKNYKTWMNILFWVVLILFTIVKTKIVHYSSMAYFPLTFFAAVTVYKLWQSKIKLNNMALAMLISVAFFWALFLAVLPIIDAYKHVIIDSGIIKDMFATGNLMAEVKWTLFEPVIALLFLTAVIWAALNLNKKAKKSITALGFATIGFIIFFIYIVTPRIELYSQNAAIEFFKFKKGEDVFVRNLGYKSYAPLFYSEKSRQSSMISQDTLLSGNITKDAYFVFKNTRKDEIFSKHPNLKLIKEENGFVFAMREKTAKK
ncbi:MAG: glycosyltransferase family 39 protein [Saprospiraceae bacterium]|nr:glycosyltransferase family 39 protein [Saprospiraceae bacterium]